MTLRIGEEMAETVLVLRLEGRITLGEGALALRDTVRQALEAGRRWFLLDLGQVAYLDSAGLGELVSAFTTVRRAGGSLALCHPTKKLTDLLTITKLLTVFEVFESVDAGVRAMGYEGEAPPKSRSVGCPVDGCGAWLRAPGLGPHTLTCPQCGASFTLDIGAGDTAPVSRLALPTYEGERVSLEDGSPMVLRVEGRLDLFAAEVVERAWKSVPIPRLVLIDLRGVSGPSDAGVDLVVTAIRRDQAGSRAVFVVGQGSGDSWRAGLAGFEVYEDQAKAARSFEAEGSTRRPLAAALR